MNYQLAGTTSNLSLFVDIVLTMHPQKRVWRAASFRKLILPNTETSTDTFQGGNAMAHSDDAGDDTRGKPFLIG